MKQCLLLVLLLASATIVHAGHVLPGKPASTNVRGAEYPRVLSDGRVVFRIKAPEAKGVKFRIGKDYVASRDSDERSQ